MNMTAKMAAALTEAAGTMPRRGTAFVQSFLAAHGEELVKRAMASESMKGIGFVQIHFDVAPASVTPDPLPEGVEQKTPAKRSRRPKAASKPSQPQNDPSESENP